MFGKKSRYAGEETYTVTDHRGRTVNVVLVPPRPDQMLQGYHVRRQGQRLDHLSAAYLGDPAGFWRICEFSDVMWPEALSEADELAIPNK